MMDWTKLKFGEICKVQGGFAFKSNSFTRNDEGVPIIKIGNIQNGSVVIDNKTSRVPSDFLKNKSILKFILSENDILIAMTGATTGKIGRIRKETGVCFLNQRVGRFLPIRNKTSSTFIEFMSQTVEFQKNINNNILISAQGNISPSKIEDIDVTIPSIPDQRKIAYVLSAVQKAIEQQDKLICITTELKKTLMQKLFTAGTKSEKQKQTEIGLVPESWDVVELGQYLEKSRLTDPSRSPNDEFIYVDVSSVNNELFKITKTNKLLGKDAPSRARKLIQTDDVIFATVRPTLKRIAKISEELNNQVCSTGYCVLKPMKNKLNSEYLYQFLQINDFISRIEKLQRGASYPAVRDTDVKGMKIPFPKYDEQIQIGNILNTIDRKFFIINSNKQVLSDLFKILLHELMTGERRVNKLEFENIAKESELKGKQLIMAFEE